MTPILHESMYIHTRIHMHIIGLAVIGWGYIIMHIDTYKLTASFCSGISFIFNSFTKLSISGLFNCPSYRRTRRRTSLRQSIPRMAGFLRRASTF